MNDVSRQYHQRALDFFRANPRMHVMARPADKEIIAKWFTYFDAKGMRGTLATFRQILSGNKPVMFPAPCPTLFDMSYTPPSRMWRDDEAGDKPRADVSHVVQRTLDSLRKAVPRGRQPVPKSHLAEPVKTPAEWLDDYQENPPPIPVLSDAARAKFGIADDPSEAAA